MTSTALITTTPAGTPVVVHRDARVVLAEAPDARAVVEAQASTPDTYCDALSSARSTLRAANTALTIGATGASVSGVGAAALLLTSMAAHSGNGLAVAAAALAVALASQFGMLCIGAWRRSENADSRVKLLESKVANPAIELRCAPPAPQAPVKPRNLAREIPYREQLALFNRREEVAARVATAIHALVETGELSIEGAPQRVGLQTQGPQLAGADARVPAFNHVEHGAHVWHAIARTVAARGVLAALRFDVEGDVTRVRALFDAPPKELPHV